MLDPPKSVSRLVFTPQQLFEDIASQAPGRPKLPAAPHLQPHRWGTPALCSATSLPVGKSVLGTVFQRICIYGDESKFGYLRSKVEDVPEYSLGPPFKRAF